jgi:beta-galactosidase
MNFAKPDMPMPAVMDVISVNYQGQGIRDTPEFAGTDRIRMPPQFDAYRAKFPHKVILSSETASAFSSRGVYLFPVSKEISEPVRDGRGGDSKIRQVSAYELHAVDFGSSADKVFGSLERHPFVAGEFVWTGWDHLGEPTPFDSSRSSYSGIIDLAGFKKDRFHLYQAHWRPDFPMAHILPHWTWPDRVGKVTPVHVFTSGDEGELFLNGRSLGRGKMGPFEYRLRWDHVLYEPGTLEVLTYRHGERWASDVVQTAGEPAELKLEPDRAAILADGRDLSFVAVTVTDMAGRIAPRANNRIQFGIKGPGEIVATDNGDPTNLEAFPSHDRNAFSGRCLVIVRGNTGHPGTIIVTAQAEGLKIGTVAIDATASGH